MKTGFTVEGYIRQFPAPVQKLLKQVRQTIRKAAPKAIEKIAYGMPAYHLEGPLVYFGGAKKHVGFYPTSSGIKAFQSKLGKYHWSKGAVQFPLDQPLPVSLILQMTRFRARENLTRAKARKARKKS